MADRRVLVAGASGYAGALAAELVDRHPGLALAAATSRSDVGKPLRELYPRYRSAVVLSELELDEPGRLEGIEAAIVAYPHGAAAPVVARLRELGIIVVDLSADFRLEDLATHEHWYGAHRAPELVPEAVYGLTELSREALREAELVANPGCYPTASLLALAPLAERGLLASVTIDAKSGVSGAGRGGGERLAFVSVTENVTPYGIGGHRHQPEIEQGLAKLAPSAAPNAADDAALAFVPHLVALDQGLLASCYVELTEPVGRDALVGLVRDRYAGAPFVHPVESAPGVRDVRDTNDCLVHVASLGKRRAVVFGAIDNLWKGAAGQALQNLNLMLGFDEAEGLR